MFKNIRFEKPLKHINLEFSQFNDEHFTIANQSIEFKENLKILNGLNLNGNREISDKTVVYIANNCPELLRAELYWNCRVNDFCVKKLAQKCPKLEYVNLSGCKYITDGAIKYVVDNCKNIYHLNLTRLPKLTETGVEAVALAGLTKLTYLNFYASSAISNKGFMTLAENSGYKNL